MSRVILAWYTKSRIRTAPGSPLPSTTHASRCLTLRSDEQSVIAQLTSGAQTARVDIHGQPEAGTVSQGEQLTSHSPTEPDREPR